MTKKAENSKDKVQNFLNNEKVLGKLADLDARWADEKEYEDWEEYEKVMKSLLPKGFEFQKGTKRPFGIKAKVGIIPVHFFLKKRGDYVSFAAKVA